VTARAASAQTNGADALAIAGVATAIIAVIAITVLRAPSERVFGMAIVGRHHDPFTVMAQFDGAPAPAMYWQPLTDAPGRLIARFTGGVAAYNWIVLLSFPLAALSAFLLARQLSLSRGGAALAALAFAFAPFHLAHAAYHPQIAQVQWIPLYLLAVWRCLERPSRAAAMLLIVSAGAAALSNFYGGLIAAVITPVAIAAYTLVHRRAPHIWRNASVTLVVLAVVAAAGAAYVLAFAPAVVSNRAALAFPLTDVWRYSAAAIAFVVPPVAHPLFGDAARRFWEASGVREGLLEQQVFLGWSLMALALIAIGAWLTRAANVSAVPIVVSVAAVALLFAISPPQWLYRALPMFRSYARFGMVVQLMTALAAGIGFDVLRRGASRYAKPAATALAILLAGEYAVSPPAMSRDVLPTLAHRWVTEQPGAIRAIDCVPLTPESATIIALSHDRIEIGGAATDCSEPELAQKLAASGYTHVLIRRGSIEDRGPWSSAPMSGTRVVAAFPDSEVLAILAPKPQVYTAALAGFSPREQDASWSWRWMASTSTWLVRNTTPAPVVATLGLEVSAFYHTRHLNVRLDGVTIAALEVDRERRPYPIGPFTVAPGDHALVFAAVEPATVARTMIGNGDTRPLSFAIGAWHWDTGGAQ
jgi:hypothetical protein